MKLLKLEDNDKEAKKLRLKRLLEGWENIEEVLYYQSLPYFSEVIRLEVISRYHDNPLAGHFGIKNT